MSVAICYVEPRSGFPPQFLGLTVCIITLRIQGSVHFKDLLNNDLKFSETSLQCTSRDLEESTS